MNVGKGKKKIGGGSYKEVESGDIGGNLWVYGSEGLHKVCKSKNPLW